MNVKNREFVGTYHVSETDKIRVIVHGRHLMFGNWVVIATELIPSLSGEGEWHGSTLIIPTVENLTWVIADKLTWGGESVKVRHLPLVNRDGIRIDYVGNVSVVQLSDRGKFHAIDMYVSGLPTVGDVNVSTLCDRSVESKGYMSVSEFMSDKSCKTCQKKLSALHDDMINDC